MVHETRIAPRRDELITSDNRMTRRFAEFLEEQADAVNSLDEKSGVQDSLIALSNRQRGKITNLEQEVADLKEMIFELSARKKPVEQDSESDDERFAINRLHNKITDLTNRLDDIEALSLAPNRNKLTSLESRLDDVEAEAGHTPKPALPEIDPLLIIGPSSATDNAISRFDGATGQLLQDSSVIIDDSDNITGVVKFTSDDLTTLPDKSSLLTFGRFSAGYQWVLIRPDSTALGIEIRTNAGTSMLQLTQSSLLATFGGDISVRGGDWSATGIDLASGDTYSVNSTQVVAAQEAAVSDASGGATVDAEARTAINALLARLRTHGLIAT